MYFMFCLIFLIIVVDTVTIRHQFDDDHPFVTDTKDKKHHKFMLIPSIGFEMNDKPNQFTLILNGWYYEPLNSNFLQNFIKNSFQAVLHLVDSSEKFSEEEKQERLGPFFVRDIADHEIELRLSKSISQTVSTDENGRFQETIIVDSLNGLNIKGQTLKYTASDEDFHEQGDEGLIYLMKNQHGCSIISDIDDTIKISEVPNKKKLIVNTFKKDFKAVPGMSDLYRSWRSSHHCLIHYVSAMPSQLYYVTQKFLNKEKFPGGSFHMRHLKLVGSDKYELFKKIRDFVQHDASQIHKLTVINNILDYAPIHQQFIMVGDSGELDPEIYGEIARKYSERIKMIFIRLVEGGKNDDSRFNAAFKDVSNDKWRTFFNANELPQKLFKDDDLINENDADDDDDDDSTNKAMVLSISFYYHLLTLTLTVLYV